MRAAGQRAGRSSPELSAAQAFVYYRTYARWLEDEHRREEWSESVERYFDFFSARFAGAVPDAVWTRAFEHVHAMAVMPSMRALWSAGPALEHNHIFAYNCCCLAFSELRRPVELFFILMCGAGVGFSVERRYIDQMPAVRPASSLAIRHRVADSREGWADSLAIALDTWFGGGDVEFDYSGVRPAGSRLRTFGGRAPGPEPLRRLHRAVRAVIAGARGRKLRPIEWLDVGNLIAEAVLAGGSRRASEIALSDLDDEELRHAKDAPFPPHRAMSNNSAVYFGRPPAAAFRAEWAALIAGGTGERGIFNARAAAGASARRAPSEHLRPNPCGEVLLRADTGEFCNLTEVVLRPSDTLDGAVDKVRTAVWLGAMQACLTSFPYLGASYREMCERERLLGVSLTGQMDNPGLVAQPALAVLRRAALDECAAACRALGIPMSAAVTSGKPSGTVSQLVACAPGSHPHYARHYIRRYRISALDPLFHMMRDQGVRFHAEVGSPPGEPVSTYVVEFPEAAPPGAIVRADVRAIDQLEHYLRMTQYWCEHNQSTTIYVRPDEWQPVGDWVHEHFDAITGLSFLPFDGGTYELAPYEEIDEHRYRELSRAMPRIDYSRLRDYERDDPAASDPSLVASLGPPAAPSFACAGGACED
jgi:ribonucleoside-diphosphate reductase alpha chain